jgi:hypothetical protein
LGAITAGEAAKGLEPDGVPHRSDS